MIILQGKTLEKPKRQKPDYVKTMRQVVEAVIPLSPDKQEFDWFAHDPAAKAAVHVEKGRYCSERSKEDARYGGTVQPARADRLRIVSTEGKVGGIYADGPGRFEVDGAVVSLSGDSTGIGGPATGAAVNHGADLTVRNAVIDVSGLTHYATASENNSILRVYDSVIGSHGAPFGHGEPQPEKPMQTPPPPLMIQGNSRTHCSMTNSQSYFYNTVITADGWGALSTEAAEGYVYIEANDCEIVTVQRGYAAYADPGCYVNMNRCLVDSADMAGIIGGEGEMNFYDCRVCCNANFMLVHGVFGDPREISYVTVSGSSVRSVKDLILVKSRNAVIHCKDSKLEAGSGILVHSVLNDDFLATPVGEDPYGIDVKLEDLDAVGDILHEDSEREMWLTLEHASVRGKISGAHVRMDKGSRWFATADSDITLLGQAFLGQLDAPEGVTIHVHGEAEGQQELPSGGILVLTK